MEDLSQMTIGQIAAADFRNCGVFEKYRLDYFNHGKRSLKEAIEGKDISEQDLLEALNKAGEEAAAENTDFNEWDLDVLCNYIEEHHHRPAEKRIAAIKPELAKLAEELSASHPQFAEIKTLFDTVAGQIAVHQKKEELILFPFIRKMAKSKRDNVPFVRPPLTKSAENPVNMLTHEHNDQGEAFEKIAELTNVYITDDGALIDIYATLADFERELHTHIHLENNILFPKALVMDSEI
ncbi:MAG: DUF542 domain-containing protein [Chitinophagaceae bacterium]|nr:DUF542 domain-containing protein [Chitinophagaceae bacterium]